MEKLDESILIGQQFQVRNILKFLSKKKGMILLIRHKISEYDLGVKILISIEQYHHWNRDTKELMERKLKINTANQF